MNCVVLPLFSQFIDLYFMVTHQIKKSQSLAEYEEQFGSSCASITKIFHTLEEHKVHWIVLIFCWLALRNKTADIFKFRLIIDSLLAITKANNTVLQMSFPLHFTLDFLFGNDNKCIKNDWWPTIVRQYLFLFNLSWVPQHWTRPLL